MCKINKEYIYIQKRLKIIQNENKSENIILQYNLGSYSNSYSKKI